MVLLPLVWDHSGEIVTLFLATQLKRVGAGGGVAHAENITVHEVPLTQIVPWLEAKAKDGCFGGSQGLCGFVFHHAK